MQADGSVLGSAINCAVLALLDAGVAMRGVLAATTCVVYDDDDRPGRTVVGDEDEKTKYEEDDYDGVFGSGRRGTAVLVAESSSSDNVDADSDDGRGSLSRCTPSARRCRSTGCCRPSNVPARAAPRRWRHSLGSSSRGRCRGRCRVRVHIQYRPIIDVVADIDVVILAIVIIVVVVVEQRRVRRPAFALGDVDPW